MLIKKSLDVGARAEKVWKVIAQDYGQVDRWASAVNVSTPIHGRGPTDSAPMAGRTCNTSLGPFKEAIVEFDEKNFVIAYSATGEKMPFFVRSMVARWTLTRIGSHETRVEMALTVGLLPVFNILMALPMRMQLGKVLGESLEECKYFVENGKPHPRKSKLLAAAA